MKTLKTEIVFLPLGAEVVQYGKSEVCQKYYRRNNNEQYKLYYTQ